MQQILRFLVRMLPPALLAAAVFLSLLPIRRRRHSGAQRYSTPVREVVVLLLWMFLAGLYTLAWTPGAAGQGSLNVIPLRILRDTWVSVLAGNWMPLIVGLLGNLLMFVPLGLAAGLLIRSATWRYAALCGFAASLLIELGQLFCSRSTDIDDLILNTAGALAGYGLCVLLRRWAPAFATQCTLQKTEDS